MSRPVRVMFVCWGNICRSPMAERIAEAWAERQGLTGVEFTSSGVSAEEHGNPMDDRAARLLAEQGYRTGGHRAHKVTRAELGADLVIAMEEVHASILRRQAPGSDNLFLLSDFNPDMAEGEGVPDPWYGGRQGFVATQEAIEGAMPALMDRLRELQAS